MRKRTGVVLRIGRLAITVVVLAVVMVVLYSRREELVALSAVRPRDFAVLVAAMTALFLASGYSFYLLVRMLSVTLTATEWISLQFIGSAFNYIGPARLGVVAKAAYLKRRSAMAYSRFSAVLVASVLLVLFSTAVMGGIILLFLRPERNAMLVLGSVSGAVIAAVLVPLLAPLPVQRKGGRVWDFLDNAVRGFEEIRSHRRQMVAFGLTVVVQHGFSAVCCFVAFRALGYEISWLVALALAVFTALANAVSVTPNNIGVLELVMASVYGAAGMDFSEGLLGASLIRGAHILVSFLPVPLFMRLLLKSSGLHLSSLLSGSADERVLKAPPGP